MDACEHPVARNIRAFHVYKGYVYSMHSLQRCSVSALSPSCHLCTPQNWIPLGHQCTLTPNTFSASHTKPIRQLFAETLQQPRRNQKSVKVAQTNSSCMQAGRCCTWFMSSRLIVRTSNDSPRGMYLMANSCPVLRSRASCTKPDAPLHTTADLNNHPPTKCMFQQCCLLSGWGPTLASQ